MRTLFPFVLFSTFRFISFRFPVSSAKVILAYHPSLFSSKKRNLYLISLIIPSSEMLHIMLHIPFISQLLFELREGKFFYWFSLEDLFASRLTQFQNSFIIWSSRRSGEIGIRTRLKIWREQSHDGSTPSFGILSSFHKPFISN